MGWYVYVLTSETAGKTYVGISRDVVRRVEQHNGRVGGGARSTRAGRPWTLGAVYGPYPDRGAAQSAEARVRRVRGEARLAVDGEPRPDQPAGRNAG